MRSKLGNHRGYRRSRLKINGKCHDGALLVARSLE